MRNPRSCYGVAALVVMMSVSVLLAQGGETIHDAVARGASGRFTTVPSGKPPAIDHVLRDTDMIVRGIVGTSRSYISEDQQDIYTEYEISNPIVLYQSAISVSKTPNAGDPITVNLLGGTITFGGRSFTQTEQALPPLKPGTEVLLLLQRVGTKYRIAGTYYGAFRIDGEKLRPLVAKATFAPEYRDVPVVTAVAQLVERVRIMRLTVP